MAVGDQAACSILRLTTTPSLPSLLHTLDPSKNGPLTSHLPAAVPVVLGVVEEPAREVLHQEGEALACLLHLHRLHGLLIRILVVPQVVTRLQLQARHGVVKLQHPILRSDLHNQPTGIFGGCVVHLGEIICQLNVSDGKFWRQEFFL